MRESGEIRVWIYTSVWVWGAGSQKWKSRKVRKGETTRTIKLEKGEKHENEKKVKSMNQGNCDGRSDPGYWAYTMVWVWSAEEQKRSKRESPAKPRTGFEPVTFSV